MNIAGKPNLGLLRARFNRQRGVAELAADIALALAVLLLIGALFMGWQAWLIARQSTVAQDLVQDKAQALAGVSAAVTSQQREVERALANPTVREALGTGDADARAHAAQLLKALLPQAHDVAFYSVSLDEVLKGNLQQIGYARAAQLMRAQGASAAAPEEVRTRAPQTVSYAQAVMGAQGTPIAYVVVEMPFSDIRAAFDAIDVGAGRMELRQGDSSDSLLVAMRGAEGLSTDDDSGVPVPHSRLRIATAAPSYWLPATQSLAVAATLAALALIVALGLFFARARIRNRSDVAIDTGPSMSELAPPPTRKAEAPAPAAMPPVESPSPPAAPVQTGAIERSIFRAYDIRGVVGTSLTEDTARAIGRAVGSVMREKSLSDIVVGRDGRLSGPRISGALIDGLRASGVDVIDIGAAPTPVVYFASFHLNTGCCVAVTGSHNPPDYNGFKIVVGGETLAEDAIQDLYARIVEGRLAEGRGSLRQMDVAHYYVQRIASDIQTGRPLKVVIDAGNGIAGAIAPQVIEAINCEAIPLYCEVDGNFPHHHPDPSDPENLSDLILMVKKTGADLGLAFDGDGDRLGVVSRDGEIIYPDRVLMLFAMDVLLRDPGATIIYDVKCTGHLQPLILKAGGSPLMWKTGHSLIKAKMQETGAQLAGEMSGHFFFRERWYGFDDGIYSAARLLEILADDPAGRTPEQMFAVLPKGVSTPELKAPMREGEHYAFIERFRERAQFEGARITTIDGVRADWPDGWGLVRASNTTPVLVLRFDADNAEALQRIQETFRTQLLAVDANLQLPF